MSGPRKRPVPGSVREKVMQRDGHKCFFCSMSRLQSEHMFGTSLHVHHLKLDGAADDTDNSLQNLCVMCSLCHQKLHALIKKLLDAYSIDLTKLKK